MKHTILPIGFLCFSLSLASAGAYANTVLATASALIVDTIAVVSQTHLNFGYITPTISGGTVTISPHNQRTTTGSVGVERDYARAEFGINGKPGLVYSIHTPEKLNFTASETSGNGSGNDMLTVKNFVTYSVGAQNAGGVGKLGNDGKDMVYLGGTLVVPHDTEPGIYRGLVPLTVSY